MILLYDASIPGIENASVTAGGDNYENKDSFAGGVVRVRAGVSI